MKTLSNLVWNKFKAKTHKHMNPALDFMKTEVGMLFRLLQDHKNKLTSVGGNHITNPTKSAGGIGVFKNGSTVETSPGWFLTQIHPLHPLTKKKKVGRPSDFSTL